MLRIVFSLLIFAAQQTQAADKTDQQWPATTLSDTTIKNVQTAKYNYLKCIAKEAKKKHYARMDTRAATDRILKQCEKPLTEIKKVFNQEKIPEHISSRYLQRTRTMTARKVLEQMMINAALR